MGLRSNGTLAKLATFLGGAHREGAFVFLPLLRVSTTCLILYHDAPFLVCVHMHITRFLPHSGSLAFSRWCVARPGLLVRVRCTDMRALPPAEPARPHSVPSQLYGTRSGASFHEPARPVNRIAPVCLSHTPLGAGRLNGALVCKQGKEYLPKMRSQLFLEAELSVF
jgi:hypothetical protein